MNSFSSFRLINKSRASTERTSEVGGHSFCLSDTWSFQQLWGCRIRGKWRNIACTYPVFKVIVSFITFLNWIGSSCREEILLSSNSFLGSTHLIVFLPCCVSICLLIHLLWWDDNSVSTYFQILIFPPQNFSEPCYQVKEEREKLSCFGLMLQITTKQKVKSYWKTIC